MVDSLHSIYSYSLPQPSLDNTQAIIQSAHILRQSSNRQPLLLAQQHHVDHHTSHRPSGPSGGPFQVPEGIQFRWLQEELQLLSLQVTSSVSSLEDANNTRVRLCWSLIRIYSCSTYVLEHLRRLLRTYERRKHRCAR